jgi:hypothetical protein
MNKPVMFLVLASVGLCAPARANDVTAITFMPTHASTNTLPASPAFGTFIPFVSQPVNDCSGNALATGLRVFTDGSSVRGLRLRCRNFGVIGATDTFSVFDQPLMGAGTGAANPEITSRLLECESGEAITGINVRSGINVDAIGISCHVVSPSFATLVRFVADELFLNGRGSVVNAGTTGMVTGLIGGRGGFSASFECGSQTPFVRDIQTSANDRINGVRVNCSQVLDKVLDPSATQADLAVRTVSQTRVLSAGFTDAFRAEVFNLGGVIPNPGADTFVDLIFSSTDLQFTGIPTNCDFLSAGRIRCSIPNAAQLQDGLSSSLGTFFMQPLHSRPEAPLFVVQATFEIDDSDFSNNTYGFGVTVP